jgi:glycine betaine/proline transport system ATP-binding protein
MKDGRFIQVGTPQEIVTQPIDPYVRDFVRGISKLKFVRARSLMCQVDKYLSSCGRDGGNFDRYIRVGEDTDLDRLIQLKVNASNLDPLVVINGEGCTVGVVTVMDLLTGIRSN